MMKHIQMTPALYDYMLEVSLRDDPVLADLRAETAKLPLANMQVAPEQAQFMQFLLRMLQAKNVLEIGTFTGYSALAMAMALPDDGKIITCDINTDWTSIAKPFWQQSGHGHKIDLQIGPAKEAMFSLLNDGHDSYFDFIFIDADKTNYVSYYELALKLLRPGGVIAIDNVFWDGLVVEEPKDDPQTREIRRLNNIIKQDNNVRISMVPIADGLFLIQS